MVRFALSKKVLELNTKLKSTRALTREYLNAEISHRF